MGAINHQKWVVYGIAISTLQAITTVPDYEIPFLDDLHGTFVMKNVGQIWGLGNQLLSAPILLFPTPIVCVYCFATLCMAHPLLSECSGNLFFFLLW